jgi:type VI secretion system secreted protein Hcp
MAAVDYFLNIDGIPGESQDDKHRDEIEVESWSWGATNNTLGGGAGGGGGAGKVNMSDLVFTSRISKASPQLMLACASGKHIKEAVLTARRTGGTEFEFLNLTLSDVLVSSFRTGDEGEGDGRPVDSISLNFSQIEVEYRSMKPDGSVGDSAKAGWDVKQNKPI